jgi:hypothetical protein
MLLGNYQFLNLITLIIFNYFTQSKASIFYVEVKNITNLLYIELSTVSQVSYIIRAISEIYFRIASLEEK